MGLGTPEPGLSPTPQSRNRIFLSTVLPGSWDRRSSPSAKTNPTSQFFDPSFRTPGRQLLVQHLIETIPNGGVTTVPLPLVRQVHYHRKRVVVKERPTLFNK